MVIGILEKTMTTSTKQAAEKIKEIVEPEHLYAINKMLKIHSRTTELESKRDEEFRARIVE